MPHPTDDFDPFVPAIFDLMKISNFLNIQQAEFSVTRCLGHLSMQGVAVLSGRLLGIGEADTGAGRGALAHAGTRRR